MVPSLLFLLVTVFSLLGNIRGDALRSDPTSEIEIAWHRDTSVQSMEDIIQKLAK